MNRHTTRIALATVLAPLAIIPVVAGFTVVDAIRSVSDSAGVLASLDVFFLYAAFGLAVAYPVTLIFGVPTYLILVRRENASFPIVIGTGALAALCLAFFIFQYPMNPTDLIFGTFFVACGASVAALFRGIAGVPG